MIRPSGITAVIVTRGNVDLKPIENSLYSTKFDSVHIYDNSQLINFRVLSRYLLGQIFGTEYIYVQDDDCIVDLEHYPWDQVSPSHILCNMPAVYRPNYPGSIQLVGFGSIFHRSLIRPTFERYLKHYSLDDITLLEADRIFTGLNPTKLVDVPIIHLPHATSLDCLYRQPDHMTRLVTAQYRINAIKEKS